MFFISSGFSKQSTITRLSCAALLSVLGATSAWGQVPSVVIDSQQVIGTGFNNPQSLAVNGTNQGAIFIADTNNNQIIALLNNYNFPFQPTGITLRNPQAVALDSKGDLFIGDEPLVNGVAVGRISEIPADNTGNLAGGGQVVFQGAPLSNPTALTVDSAGTLYIGDYPASGAAALYSMAAGATAPTLLPITNGPPVQWLPSALLVTATGTLYFADDGNLQGSNGNVYQVATTGGVATALSTPSFTLNQPSGLALNGTGDLHILTLLDTGAGLKQQVLVLPAMSPSTPYVLPTAGINTASGLAFDANNKLNITDAFLNDVVQVSYGSPTNFGSVNVGQSGGQVAFNFEFNQPTTLSGFRVMTEGDISTDLTQVSGGTCKNKTYSNLTPATPYTCAETYQATPTYPGLRTSAIVARGPNNTILASTPVYQIGFAGAEVTYPMKATATATNLAEPQAVVISGDNKTVYVADAQTGKVYSIAGLGGTATTPVSTGAFPLQAPIGLALDGAGDLFIADFNLAEVIEVPTASGAAPTLVNTGGLLQHPMTLAVDTAGNLYIGDAGPAGFSASAGTPGFIVKVPVGQAAFKMSIPSTPIIFPQALATSFYTNNLYIGDGGDASQTSGKVDVVTPDGSASGQVNLPGVTDPTGLAFDPGGDLYVLDGNSNTVTGLQVNNSDSTPYNVGFDNTTLAAASALAISAGGQSFVIANIGAGSDNSLVYLNGNRSTLAFGGVKGDSSSTMTAMEFNVGNQTLTLGSPYYSATPANSAFSILDSSTCRPNVTLTSGTGCSINAQFTPASAGQTTQQVTIVSTGYNSGVPILTLQGTGKAAAVAKPAKK